MFSSKKPVERLNLLVAVLLALFSSSSFAKSLCLKQPEMELPRRLSRLDIESLENRLRPFLEHRINRRHSRSTVYSSKSYSHLENDLRILGKAWHFLSSEFKKLYKEAVQLPDSFQRYDSPGGHFEIYYTTSGLDRVDSTDRYGYSETNWREKTDFANNIPDYIDEVAFALDSSWAMEIDRFQFVAPAPYKSSHHSSNRYKVVVEEQEVSYYGLTYLLDTINGGHGYISMISLRNDWSDGEWSSLGYDIRPHDGIRVTCAHEFFHAIQYAMSWDVVCDIWLDDFPLSWTEGTAVSMEELAFDSINDYHQYAKTYFNDPGISFFSRATSDLVYTNAILLLYLFKHSPPGNSINFVHSVAFTNYRHRTSFHENLLATALNAGRSWRELLHNFHLASLFTGNNADTSIFINDASYFKMRTIPEYSMAAQFKKNVEFNSAELLRLVPASHHSDTLALNISGDALPGDSASGIGWTCSAILRKNSIHSFFPIQITSQGRGTASISNWKRFDEIILVITNGDPFSERNITVSFAMGTTPLYRDIAIFPNPISLSRHHGKVNIRGNTISNIFIHTINGTLVWHYSAKTENSSSPITRGYHTWDCKNSSGSIIVPGTYTAIVVRNDHSYNAPIRTRHKLLIIP